MLPFLPLAQIPDPKPDTYVNDYTNTLTATETQVLNQQLCDLEQHTNIQCAVLLIHKLPADMAIEDYARMVGNQWKVGNAYNGIVYVAVLGERIHRLEIARNLEPVIPDMIAAQIIDNLKPYLRSENYYQAMVTLIAQIKYHVGNGEAPVIDSTAYPLSEERFDIRDELVNKEREAFEKEKAKYDGYGDVAIGFMIVGAIGVSIWAWRYKKRYVKKNTVNGVYIGIGSSYYSSIYGSSGSSSYSGGSSGFGGWGGGGGGGGFSGGGASGSW